MTISDEVKALLKSNGVPPETLTDLERAASSLNESTPTSISNSYTNEQLLDLITYFRKMIAVYDPRLLSPGTLLVDLWKNSGPGEAVEDNAFFVELEAPSVSPSELVGPSGAGSDEQEEWQKALWADKPYKDRR